LTAVQGRFRGSGTRCVYLVPYRGLDPRSAGRPMRSARRRQQALTSGQLSSHGGRRCLSTPHPGPVGTRAVCARERRDRHRRGRHRRDLQRDRPGLPAHLRTRTDPDADLRPAAVRGLRPARRLHHRRACPDRRRGRGHGRVPAQTAERRQRRGLPGDRREPHGAAAAEPPLPRESPGDLAVHLFLFEDDGGSGPGTPGVAAEK
jgi:hypothetical protein